MKPQTKFEKGNYGTPRAKRGWTIPIVVAGVLLSGTYFATNFWMGCADWGIVKGCTVIAKP